MSSQMNNNEKNISRGPALRLLKPRVLNDDGEQISLFIPRVDTRTTFEKVFYVFNKYNLGQVKNVDFVLKQDKNGYEFKAAYIHFNCFYNTNDCCWFIDSIRYNYYENVPCDKYDKSKMWSVYINTGKKHVNKGLLPKKCLNLDLLNVEVFNNEIPEDKLITEIKALLHTRINNKREELHVKLEEAKSELNSINMEAGGMKYLSDNEIIELGQQFGFVTKDLEEGGELKIVKNV